MTSDSEMKPGDAVNVPKDLSKWGINEPTPEGDEPEPAVVEEVLEGLLGTEEQADVVKLSHPEWNESYFVPKNELNQPSQDA
jgi:hypothetical protein